MATGVLDIVLSSQSQKSTTFRRLYIPLSSGEKGKGENLLSYALCKYNFQTRNYLR